MGSARVTIAMGAVAGTVVVSVHGRLDHASAGHLESVLTDLINSQERAALVVDLHDAHGCDRAALSALARVAQLARGGGGTLALRGPGDSISPALEAAGLASLISDDRPHRPRAGITEPVRDDGNQDSRRGVHPAGGAQYWRHRPGQL
jgi:anti-anti-sigma factor